MADTQLTMQHSSSIAVATTHKVLRNTYLLLSMTLLWSAGMAGLAMAMEAPPMGFLPLLLSLGLLFALNRLRNSGWGIVLVFAFTGVLGFCLGPILNHYLQTAGGSQTVMTAVGMTGIIFLSLSGYTLISRKDFSFLGGFLFAGMMVVIGAMLLSLVGGLFGFQIAGIQLAMSAAVVLLMAGFILFDTSRIIQGGETNYLMATVSLYLDIYNLFTSLLHLLGFFGGDD